MHSFSHKNTVGFKVPDGGIRGGYLIRAVRRVFDNLLKKSLDKNLDQIVNNIRDEVRELVAQGTQAAVDDVNTMAHKIKFSKKEK